ncbi:MAG TPA: hypothetical protein GX704_04595 [Clostridiales bacterium]|jgi:hypothetical protein|nr:hypothetical protein [Clostridiales bacterium]
MKKYLKPILIFADVFAVASALAAPFLCRLIPRIFGDTLPMLGTGFIIYIIVWALIWMYTALSRSGNMKLFGAVYWFLQTAAMASTLIPGIGALPGEEADIVSFLSVVLSEYYIKPIRALFSQLTGYSSVFCSLFIAVFLILFALLPAKEKPAEINETEQANPETDEKLNIDSEENEKT